MGIQQPLALCRWVYREPPAPGKLFPRGAEAVACASAGGASPTPSSSLPPARA